ncbi:MAG: ABC transporter ATP-binding protein [Thermoproteota archaeon]|jgi:ABC-type branched-subunit amino acid transport system ATPase component|nr:ABC transporter ATP-binding protein [Thermoproteota archaeon]
MINLKPNFEINRDNSIISLDNVNAGYGSLQVLFNISFGIPDRSFVAIVGRNGAGKTTLLKTISGFIKPYSGKIIYKGDDITNLPPYKRAQMGLVYLRQDKRIFDNLTTKECLEITAYAFNKSKNDIEKVLEHFPRLKERIDSKSKFLSGGERQMLLLAQGLLSGAEILMIDEPSEGLAAGIIRELSKVFIELKKEAQKTIIVVEQNVQLVRMLADIVIVLAEGKIIDIIEDRSSIENLDLGKYKI